MSEGLVGVGSLLTLGGPVVALLLGLSVVAVATALHRITAFHLAGVGCVRGAGARRRTRLAVELRGLPRDAAVARAEAALGRHEVGFRLLDAVVQVAPLLGLFGTVLGMIDAFRALQEAGAQVDPSALAGGIWVALLTTAVGLAVAMPTSLVLAWLDARLARERLLTAEALTAEMGNAA
ncbi:MotA/TolQ/ExbB proton channel family protein [Roseitranquillus sediminis]|uniref:MotA/TolQ/ExbB proton channel family protein n=1 Tax=Roseitranquillus sediminis TaxID=2809051 RepID=UPI001D0BF6A3|nr:MotA/TolQ/ExbB proton channel family protein [Roseitranquillus sediminis]MBM9594401.1 MotA/TolQ/ExbB proton channel family protein [Roseitranquillus sediminis]